MALVWLEIDGETPPTPSSFEPVYSDFDSDNSKRNEAGYLHRTVIRKGQVSPKFTWKALTTLQLNQILTMIEPDHLQVTFYDPKTLRLKTIDAYAQATRQPKLIRSRNTYDECLWSLELSFIEY